MKRSLDGIYVSQQLLNIVKDVSDEELMCKCLTKYINTLVNDDTRDKYVAERSNILKYMRYAKECFGYKKIGLKQRFEIGLYRLNGNLYWNIAKVVFKYRKRVQKHMKEKIKTCATIITIYDPHPNYGNRLQNYAVQTVLEKLGFEVVTISYQKKLYENKRWLLKYIVHRLTGYKLSKRKYYWKCVPLQVMVFNKFNRKYIHTRYIKRLKDIGIADYFVLGSDQVWNTAFYNDCELKKDMYLLTFAKPEQKVCFSPSFGVEKLPEEWIPWFKEHLATFPSFFVREEAGAQLIKELTGKDAAVTIDPVLMLDKEDWLRIARKPEKVDCAKKYILTLFYGDGWRTEAIDKEMKEYAAKIGDTAVYRLMDYTQPDLHTVGPSEFIYLIANARLVLTDSFHACVLSFLFGKPFLYYDVRPSMNSRMETLFDKFDLRRKDVNSGLPNDLLECDYSAGYAALQSEREKLLNYLKTEMGI